MDKQDLMTQLERQLREKARDAARSARECADEAMNGASSKEKTVDSRVAIEFASLARGQKERATKATSALQAIEGFTPPALSNRSRVEVGAVVEIEDEESGEGRTFFLAPVGAGMTLLGPDGDGHLSVVTPVSPIGKAVLGKRVGDVVDVTVKGDVREWQIVWVE
jgi:transcription elongation GreA/GreB family factor